MEDIDRSLLIPRDITAFRRRVFPRGSSFNAVMILSRRYSDEVREIAEVAKKVATIGNKPEPSQLAELSDLELLAWADRLRKSIASDDTISVDRIIKCVALHYKVTVTDIKSARRTANVVRPRQVAMYLAKTMTLKSLPEIGRRFGGRDHTTVLHAVRKMDALIETDAALADAVESIKAIVNGAPQ